MCVYTEIMNFNWDLVENVGIRPAQKVPHSNVWSVVMVAVEWEFCEKQNVLSCPLMASDKF